MRLCFFFISLFMATSATAQLDANTSTVLQKTQKAIAALTNYSYELTREYNYASENYTNAQQGKVSLYKNVNDSILGFSVYGVSKIYNTFYRNYQDFTLVHNDSSIEVSSKVDSNSIAAMSFVSYSILSFQNLIPQLLLPNNYAITTTDSTINGKKYFKVKVITKESYFDFYGLKPVNEKGFVREIFLLIDATTYLPYQYFAQFKVTSYGVDFLRNTYTNINTNIAALSDKEWELGTYMPPYKIKPSEERKLIAVGEAFPKGNLQWYKPKGNTTVNTSSFKNNKTLFYFWIKSCGPCVAAFPKLIALQKKYKAKGVEVVMVNCFDKEKDIAFFYKKHNPNFTMLYNAINFQNKIGIWGYPTVVIVDENQKVLYSGGWDDDEILKIL